MPIRVGTAAWAIPKPSSQAFPAAGGSVLERYARVFDAVEINSSFYRPHRRKTYERWAASVPDGFRFAVKVPKAISHEARLHDCADRIALFLDEIAGLGSRLGAVLLQLPPGLAFEPATAGAACTHLRGAGPLACEPRHASWFTPQADRWLTERGIARVAADPPRGDGGDRPGGWTGLAYYRLHGSPRVYYSPYPADALVKLAERLTGGDAETTWCIFDNTALGAATADALALNGALGEAAAC